MSDEDRERLETISTAIREMLASGENLTKSGLPELPALKERAGVEVSGKERDALTAAIKAAADTEGEGGDAGNAQPDAPATGDTHDEDLGRDEAAPAKQEVRTSRREGGERMATLVKATRHMMERRANLGPGGRPTRLRLRSETGIDPTEAEWDEACTAARAQLNKGQGTA